jgi:glycosyltransferase involved in cell wall biosynthesis
MRVLISDQDIQNTYIYSLIEAYKRAGCEVISGPVDFYTTNYCPDLLHIQWPEGLYGNDYSVLGPPDKAIPSRIGFFKDHGAKVIFTVHNIRPHERANFSFAKSVYTSIIKLSDIIVHHGYASIKLFTNEYPMSAEKTHIVCPHGHYLAQYKQISNFDARDYLRLPRDKFILLWFGNIAPYKGYELLKRIFGRWPKKNKYLLVAGRLSVHPNNLAQKVRRHWRKIHNKGHNWRMDIRYIKTSDIAYYFSAADTGILTHTEGLTSGVLAMAATFKLPIVYPSIGNFPEQVENWCARSYPPGNINAAVAELNKLTSEVHDRRDLDNSIWLINNDWDRHVERILSTYHQISP